MYIFNEFLLEIIFLKSNVYFLHIAILLKYLLYRCVVYAFLCLLLEYTSKGFGGITVVMTG